MQTLLPAVRSVSLSTALPPQRLLHGRQSHRPLSPPISLAFPLKPPKTLPFSRSLPSCDLKTTRDSFLSFSAANASSPISPSDEETAKLSQVAKRLENTSRYFMLLGSLGFWGQLICTLVAAVILSYSIVVTRRISSLVTFYATAGGITAGFVSVFWSFGYIRLSDKLRRTAYEPSKAPPRADVVKSLKNGIVVNFLGMGAAILGMQAKVGYLVAMALTSSAIPYFQTIAPGYYPVFTSDVFLVQASANTILSHFLGLVFSLELLRSVTLPPSESVQIQMVA